MIQIKRVGSRWVATICWLHGSLKIFADSREEAIRKEFAVLPRRRINHRTRFR